MGDKRITALAAILLIVLGVAGGYLAGHGGGKTTTVTITVGEPLTAARPPYRPCAKLGINAVEGKQGTCIRKGVVYTVVNRHTPLVLKQLEARIADVAVSDSVSGAQAGTGSAYVVAQLAVRNKLEATAQFDDAEQVLLADAKNEYAEDRRAGQLVKDSFVRQGTRIPAGGSATGKVVFKTSKRFAQSLSRPGTNLIIGNFNDAGRLERAKHLGVVRVWK